MFTLSGVCVCFGSCSITMGDTNDVCVRALGIYHTHKGKAECRLIKKEPLHMYRKRTMLLSVHVYFLFGILKPCSSELLFTSGKQRWTS